MKGIAMSEVEVDWDVAGIELPASRFMTVEVGSTVHGTSISGQDDLDVACIWVEPLQDVLKPNPSKGRKMIRTAEDGVRSRAGDIDAQVFTLRAWTGLAVKGNPSILQMLWCPSVDGEFSYEAALLRASSDLFVGPHIIAPYRGYMRSQALRLVGKVGGQHGPRAEFNADVGYDTKYAMHAARLGCQALELLDTGRLVLPIGGERGDRLRAVRRGEVGFGDYFSWLLDLDVELGKRAAAFDGFPQVLRFLSDDRMASIMAVVEHIHLRFWGKTGVGFRPGWLS